MVLFTTGNDDQIRVTVWALFDRWNGVEITEDVFELGEKEEMENENGDVMFLLDCVEDVVLIPKYWVETSTTNCELCVNGEFINLSKSEDELVNDLKSVLELDVQGK